VARDPHGFPVTELARLYVDGRDDVEGMRRAAGLDALPDSWRQWFRTQLDSRGVKSRRSGRPNRPERCPITRRAGSQRCTFDVPAQRGSGSFHS
jgi:hypothetical protein